MLSIWTVYDHPKDYPDNYVARLFITDKEGFVPTDSIIITDSLETLRTILLTQMNLTRISRYNEDDPKIVEVWI